MLAALPRWTFRRGRSRRESGFTLIELLVVIAILALLISILVPSIVKAKEQAKAIQCRSNLRSIMLANAMYAASNQDLYVPGSSDMGTPTYANLHRWYGTRPDVNSPFTDKDSPLLSYLPNKEFRDCPTLPERAFYTGSGAFEAGCGGYGYNVYFVGCQYTDTGNPMSDFNYAVGNRDTAFAAPTATIAFADAAFVPSWGDAAGQVIEYSFTECPIYVGWGGAASPSIHFRHSGQANVAWLDAHVTNEPINNDPNTVTDPTGVKLGWFGPVGVNDLFDCQ